MKFILASKSPRRKELFKLMKIDFEIVDSKIDESLISKNISPEHYCLLLANLKASNVSLHCENYTVVGADTIVVLNNEILNKPKDFKEAKNMLLKLSDSTHEVMTGVSIRNRQLNINRKFCEKTLVSFYKLNEDTIEYYLEKFQPYDKAGSYGIQDYGATFIKEIRGSYENVVGFPVSQFYQLIKKISSL